MRNRNKNKDKDNDKDTPSSYAPSRRGRPRPDNPDTRRSLDPLALKCASMRAPRNGRLAAPEVLLVGYLGKIKTRFQWRRGGLSTEQHRLVFDLTGVGLAWNVGSRRCVDVGKRRMA